MQCLGPQILVLATSLTLTSLAAAEDDPGPSTYRYHDGAREVVAERLGDAELRADGRRVAPLRLRYPGRTEAVEAWVDHTAIATLDPAWNRAEATDALAPYGVRLERPLMAAAGLWLVSSTRAEDGLQLAVRLRAASARPPRLRTLSPNLYLRVEKRADPWIPNDPRFAGQWYFDDLGMADAWGMERGDPSVTVVVVDTGCDLVHPDLDGKMDPGRDVVDGDDDPSYDLGHSGAAHGTECAGLIAAETDNGEGIAGACPECRLRCVRLLSDLAQPISTSVEAFDFALQVDAAIVSNSWGYVDPIPVPASLAQAIATVYQNGRGGRGALVLFAAGNDDRAINPDELQAAEGVFTIGAINNFQDQTPYTNTGAALDVVAPTGALTTDISGAEGDSPDDYTSTFGGTSSACPVAAGVAGLLVSAAPERTAPELYEVMIRTARPAPYANPDANGHDLIFGYGIIDPSAALRDLLGLPDDPDAGVGGSGGGHAAEPGADDEGGCGCRLGPPPPSGQALGWALALAGLGCWRRRRG
jgi:subtilisin family serine protease